MKNKDVQKEIEQFKTSEKKKEKDRKKKKKGNGRWIVQVTFLAFAVSFLFSLLSETTLPKLNFVLGLILLLFFVLLGILFDMIGVAVTSADETPFHSMSAKKVRGAAVAVILKKNADKVGSFCNDVIGDICGILTGSMGVLLAINLVTVFSWNELLTSLLVTATIASLTIGGKALGKRVAILKSDRIVYYFAKILSFVYHPKSK